MKTFQDCTNDIANEYGFDSLDDIKGQGLEQFYYKRAAQLFAEHKAQESFTDGWNAAVKQIAEQYRIYPETHCKILENLK